MATPGNNVHGKVVPVAATVVRLVPYDFSLQTLVMWALFGDLLYEIETDDIPSSIACEMILRPRDEPYDGDKAGDWNTCPFKPAKVRV